MIKPINTRFSECNGWYDGMEVVCTYTSQDCYKVGSYYSLVGHSHFGLVLIGIGDANLGYHTGYTGAFKLVSTKHLEDFL